MIRKPSVAFAGLMGLVVILKSVVVFQLRHHPLVQPAAGLDTTAYAELAARVIQGDWSLGPGLYYVSPLYIYFLALCRGLTDSYTAVRLIQILLGTAAVGFIFATAREWFGQRAAWIAAILAAFTGLFTFYEALILQTSLDVFLTSAALLCLTFALTRSSKFDRRWLFAAGLVFGIQTMNRPNIAVSVVGVALVMLALKRWRLAAVLTAGLVIGMSPAAIRNAVVSHEFSLLSSHGGLNFYIGNHARANGFYQLIPGVTPSIKGQREDVRRVAELATGRTLTDAQASDYFFNQSLNWIAGHPGKAALLMIRKFGWVFHSQHIALPYSYPFYQYDVPTWLRFYVIGPWLLIPLGLVGLVFAGLRLRSGQGTAYLIWASFVPCYAAAVALFFMSERYRLPLLVPLAAGAGGAVDYFIRQIEAPWPERSRRRRWTVIALPLAALVVVGVLVNTGRVASDGRWEEGIRMAHELVTLGRYDEAESWVSRLEAGEPRKGMVHDGLGMELKNRRQFARALPHFMKAAELDPSRPLIQYEIGQTLLDLDRPAEALPYLQRGFDGGAVLPMAGVDLAIALQKTGNAAAAEPFFRHAVELNAGSADAREQYGLNLLLLNRFEDAAAQLAEAARLDPRRATAWSHLAYSEAKLGRIAEARRHLAAALALDPADPMARQLAAVLK